MSWTWICPCLSWIRGLSEKPCRLIALNGREVGGYPIQISGPPLWSTLIVPKGPKSASRDLPSLPGGSGRLRTPPDGSVWPLRRPGKHEIGYERGRELTKQVEALPGCSHGPQDAPCTHKTLKILKKNTSIKTNGFRLGPPWASHGPPIAVDLSIDAGRKA